MDTVLSEHFDDILSHYNQYAKRPTGVNKKRLIHYISKQYKTTKGVASQVVSGTKKVFQKLNGEWKNLRHKKPSFYVPDPQIARIVGGGIVSEDNKIVNALDIIATVAALVPGVNFVAAPAAAITSILLGDVIGVILSLLELIPAIGIIPGAAKLIYRIRKIYKMSRKVKAGVTLIRGGPVRVIKPGGPLSRFQGQVQRAQGQFQKVQGQVQNVQSRIQAVQQQIQQVRPPQGQVQPARPPASFNGQLPRPGQAQQWFDWATLQYKDNVNNYDVSEKTLCKVGDQDSQLQYYILQNKDLLQLLKTASDTGRSFAGKLLLHFDKLSAYERSKRPHCGLWDITGGRRRLSRIHA